MFKLHPNAIIGGASGLAGGALVVYLFGLEHVNVDVYAAGAIFTAASSLVLFVGHNGLAGVWSFVKHGSASAPKPPAK